MNGIPSAAALWRKTIIAAVAGLTLSASGALAQSFEVGPRGFRVNPGERYETRDGVSRRQALDIARDEGLRDVDSVSRQGWRWVVDGADRRGVDMTVVISARDGRVLDVRRD